MSGLLLNFVLVAATAEKNPSPLHKEAISEYSALILRLLRPPLFCDLQQLILISWVIVVGFLLVLARLRA